MWLHVMLRWTSTVTQQLTAIKAQTPQGARRADELDPAWPSHVRQEAWQQATAASAAGRSGPAALFLAQMLVELLPHPESADFDVVVRN